MSRRSSGSSRRRCVAFMSVVLVAKEILFLTIMLGFRPTRQASSRRRRKSNKEGCGAFPSGAASESPPPQGDLIKRLDIIYARHFHFLAKCNLIPFLFQMSWRSRGRRRTFAPIRSRGTVVWVAICAAGEDLQDKEGYNWFRMASMKLSITSEGVGF